MQTDGSVVSYSVHRKGGVPVAQPESSYRNHRDSHSVRSLMVLIFGSGCFAMDALIAKRIKETA
jgi:hypothetical protein